MHTRYASFSAENEDNRRRAVVAVQPRAGEVWRAREETAALVRERGLDCDIMSSAVFQRRRD